MPIHTPALTKLLCQTGYLVNSMAFGLPIVLQDCADLACHAMQQCLLVLS